MTGADSFFDAPADTREEIMRATYLALCEHGYAGLTIQRIADEFEKSKSLIYHHYDGKDELLLAFLEFMLDRFEEEVPEDAEEDPADHLRIVFEHPLATPLPDERREFGKAMVELRAQAAHDDRYRDHFTRSDRVFRERVADVVADGIEAGVFAEVDPDATASLLMTTVTGAMTCRATSGEADVAALREELERYVETCLETRV